MITKPYILSLFMVFCSTPSFCQQSTIHNFTYFSKELNETRIIQIGLPPDYNEGQKSYPILFVLDGEYIFQNALGTVDFLSNSFGYLPELIVVGIPNTNRGKDLSVTYDPEDGFTAFSRFLEKELLPNIEQTYRTQDFRILYGWSSGSSVCSYFLGYKPELFQAFIQSGTGIGPKTADFMKRNMPKFDYQNQFLYACTEGIGPRVPSLTNYRDLLLELQPNGLNYKFEVLEDMNHVEVLSRGLYNGLKFVFSAFYIPDSITLKGADQVISYYENVGDPFNIDLKIPLGAIVESVSLLLGVEESSGEALKLAQLGVALYPESPESYGNLGEVYSILGNDSLAQSNYALALAKSLPDSINYYKYKSLVTDLNRPK